MLGSAARRACPQAPATKMPREPEFIVITTEPQDWRIERRARHPTNGLARPVASFIHAVVDTQGLAIGDLRAFFRTLPKSKKIGDPDILTAFAAEVRTVRDTRFLPERFQRIRLFMFLSYVAVVAARVRHGSELQPLEDAMKTALGTQNTNGEERYIPLDYLKSIRTGALNLHRIINRLVGEGWLPARATHTVISR